MWHRCLPLLIRRTFSAIARSGALLRRPEDESADLDALARRGVGRAGGIFKSGVCSEARAAVLFRVVALQQDHFVALVAREIEPSMVRIVGEAAGLADFVAVNQIGRNEVFGSDRARITNG